MKRTSRKRHSLTIRITHWINAIAFLGLVASGVGILIAHPALYWGQVGHFGMTPWLSLPVTQDPNHTGWGRNIHFMAAWLLVVNGAVYLLYAFLSRHIFREMLPTRPQLSLEAMLKDVKSHLMLRPILNHDAEYNLLQKLAYLAVILILLPLMLVTGLTMSPAMIAACPDLLMVFGGRQSARTIHFLSAAGLSVFLVVHLVQIVVHGPIKKVRSMITGNYQPSRTASTSGTSHKE